MQKAHHTSREFERELRTLKDRLLSMAGRAEQQIARALEAVSNRDDELAAQVIGEDIKIDQDELEIDEQAFLILARRQPVASDLRFIMLALKIVTDLERIGDLAVNIAKRERDLRRYAPAPASRRIELLGQKVLTALQQTLDAFVSEDADAAERVIAADTEIDALNMHFIADVISDENQSAHDVARSLALSSVSRYLERIGDHTTNIAEMIIYYVRGRDVRHHGPQRHGGTTYPRPRTSATNASSAAPTTDTRCSALTPSLSMVLRGFAIFFCHVSAAAAPSSKLASPSENTILSAPDFTLVCLRVLNAISSLNGPRNTTDSASSSALPWPRCLPNRTVQRASGPIR